MATIQDLINFFPTKEQSEVSGALNKLLTERIISNNVKSVANANPVSIGRYLSEYAPGVFFDSFHSEIKGIASVVWEEYGPKDPDKMTAREEAYLKQIWSLLYMKFTRERLRPVQQISNNYQLDTLTPSFEKFTKITSADLKIHADDNFYRMLAEYYISMANKYLEINNVAYTFKGKVKNDLDSNTLRSVKVQASATDDNFGVTYSNSIGYFEIDFNVVGNLRDKLPINFIFDKKGYDQLKTTIQFDPANPDGINDILMTLAESSSAKISDVTSTLGLVVPPELSTFFTDKNVNTLADIRNLGFLKNRKDLDINPDNTALRTFDSLSNLELLQPDFEKNNMLVSRGVENFVMVANTPRSSFVEAQSDIFGEYGAAKMQANSKQTLLSATTTMMAPNDPLADLPPRPGIIVEEQCGCQDCEAAVSPLAYLADLESFVFSNLTTNGSPVDQGFLADNFFQDFASLPATCRQLTLTYCQVRLATEVLTKYYGTLSLPQPVIDVFEALKFEYLVETYKLLLIKLNTSFDEIQEIQLNNDNSARKDLTDRIGIILYDSNLEEETLPYLYFDISSPGELTEVELQEVFGLAAIIDIPDTQGSYVQDWKELYLRELWMARDYGDDAFKTGETLIIDPDIIGVDDFRNPDATASNAFKIWENRREFIDDDIYGVLNAAASFSAMIDIIQDDTFTYVPISGGSVEKSDIWSNGSIDLLKGLQELIQSGDTSAVTDLWDDYNLKSPELFKLLELYTKYAETVDPPPITSPEEADFINILTTAVKRAFKAEWLTEEDNLDIALSNKEFWITQVMPKVGPWPIVELAENPIPLIDPGTMSLDGLPEITYRTVGTGESLIRYNARASELEAKKTHIIGISGYDAQIDYAFTGSGYDWAGFLTLEQELNDPNTSVNATITIETILKLSVENFLFIVDIGKRVINPSPPDPFTPKPVADTEWDRLYSILITAYKVLTLYGDGTSSGWIVDDFGTTPYWKLRKQQLAPWRASISERNAWETAFNNHNTAPIIDQDLIGPAYLKDPTPENAAFVLWKERYNEMHNDSGWYAQISNEPFDGNPNTINFDALIKEYLMAGVNLNLQLIQERIDSQEVVGKRLEQLTIDYTAFNFMIKIRTAPESSITEEDKRRLYYILAKVQKKRVFYRYKLEEEAAKITHSQDFFIVRNPDYTVSPPALPYVLNPYLVNPADLDVWLRTVSSRIDEEGSLRANYAQMLVDVDEEQLPMLRDGLITACDSSLIPFDQKARNLGDKLLINLQDNCCSKTNRIAQAIETLQQLLWKTRTGDILQDYPNLLLIADNFDAVWQWMGVYTNWRSAMFIYMYPENVLLPSLKTTRTPAFKDFLDQVQNNRSFNPYSACKAYEGYTKYLEDVQNLDLCCSVRARIVTQSDDKCHGLVDKLEDLTLVFANCSTGEYPYYCILNGEDQGFSQRTFWDKVPNIPANSILKGADFYLKDDYGVNHIYLFYMSADRDKQDRFYAIRYDCEKAVWENEPLEFVLEADDIRIMPQSWVEYIPVYIQTQLLDIDNYTLKIEVLEICQNLQYYEKPYIAISLSAGEYSQTFYQSLSKDGLKLDEGKWWSVWETKVGGPSEPDKTLFSSKVRQFIMTFKTPYEYEDYEFYYYLNSPGKDVITETYNDELDGNQISSFDLYVSKNKDYDTLLQLFTVPKPFSDPHVRNKLYLLVENGYVEYFSGTSTLGQFKTLNNQVTKISYYNSGITPNAETGISPFTYQNKDKEIFVTTQRYNEVEDKIELGENPINLIPFFGGVPAMQAPLSSDQLDNLKTYSETNLNANIESNNILLRHYAEEAYYFIPTQIALQLSNNGYYQEALDWFRNVYNYNAPEELRKIYYGLILEEYNANIADRVAEWYKDPINPHGIAATRKNTYTRFTIISIVNCMMQYANAQFTMDNAESVARARELYEDILDLVALITVANPCAIEEKILSLDSYLTNDYIGNTGIWETVFKSTFARIGGLNIPKLGPNGLDELTDTIAVVMDSSINPEEKLNQVLDQIEIAKNTHPPQSIGQKVAEYAVKLNQTVEANMGLDNFSPIYEQTTLVSEAALDNTLTGVTGFTKSELPTTDLSWLYDGSDATQKGGREFNPKTQDKIGTLYILAAKYPVPTFRINNVFPEIRISGLPFLFCVSPNPIIYALELTANAQLYKIHNCMNIAGMTRILSPFAAPTNQTSGIPVIGPGGTMQMPADLSIPPSNYRYAYLIERAKQLVALAQRTESSLLMNLEKIDAESYSRMQAEQDLETSKATVKLQELKIKEAESGVGLAELQKERADIQVSGLKGMIEVGLLLPERQLISNYTHLGSLQAELARISAITSMANNRIVAVSAGGGATSAFSVIAANILATIAGFSILAGAHKESSIADLNSNIQINQIFASLQRRLQAWEYQKTIAQQDVKIGSQQIKIANDRLRVVGQEKTIADLQSDHASATLDFLKTKFTNAELYEWMSGILEDVYAYFLQEATVIAKMAERQLAFERQLTLPSFIKSDYWAIQASGGLGNTEEIDRKGLTGSVRLLSDLTKMEQMAFNTANPKLQLSKTFSLAELDPVFFQGLIKTGKMPFVTVLQDFDRDYPGHYLRLIKRVSVTVIALNPPTKGIKATLVNSGSSQVITGGTIFQVRTVVRGGQQIALSSGVNDYGVFQLQPDDKFLNPFEGIGVETSWEFTMEKAANPFDFRSIADVLVTIEYEALSSSIYRNVVVAELNANPPVKSIVLSFKNNLPDQWFALHNPDEQEAEDIMNVKLDVTRSDMNPHTSNPIISSVDGIKVYLAVDNGETIEIDPSTIQTGVDNEISLIKYNTDNTVGLEINRAMNGEPLKNFTEFAEMNPVGKWGLKFSNNDQIRNLFREEDADNGGSNTNGGQDQQRIVDIILIFNYTSDPVPYN